MSSSAPALPPRKSEDKSKKPWSANTPWSKRYSSPSSPSASTSPDTGATTTGGGNAVPAAAEVDAKSPTGPGEVAPPTSTAEEELERSAKRKAAGKRFFSAYAKTWVTMSPLWLLGEAVTPGVKVGARFKKNARQLGTAGEELVDVLGVSGKDVVVILDERFNLSKHLNKTGTGSAVAATGQETDWGESSRRAAEVIRAAGEHAIVAVSTSLEKAQSQIHTSSPEMKKTLAKTGRDVVVLVDKGLKNPIVVSGIAKFARSKGIPYSEALLQVASMGLNKILDALPEEVENEVEETILDEAQRRRRQEQQQASTGRGGVREMDAAELERQSTPEATAEAKRAGKLGADMGDHPKVEGENDDGKCIVS